MLVNNICDCWGYLLLWLWSDEVIMSSYSSRDWRRPSVTSSSGLRSAVTSSSRSSYTGSSRDIYTSPYTTSRWSLSLVWRNSLCNILISDWAPAPVHHLHSQPWLNHHFSLPHHHCHHCHPPLMGPQLQSLTHQYLYIPMEQMAFTTPTTMTGDHLSEY